MRAAGFAASLYTWAGLGVLIGANGSSYYPVGNSTASSYPSAGLNSSLLQSDSGSITEESRSRTITRPFNSLHTIKPSPGSTTSTSISATRNGSSSQETSPAFSSTSIDRHDLLPSNSSAVPWNLVTGASQAAASSATSPKTINSTVQQHESKTSSNSSLPYSSPNSTAGLVPDSPQFMPEDWSIDYKKSDQCTSDMMAWYNITEVPTLNRQKYIYTVPAGVTYTATVRPEKYNRRTLTITGPTTTTYTEMNQAALNGPVQGCCGGCNLTAWYMDVMYWPRTGQDTRCLTMPTPSKTRAGIPWTTKGAINTGNIDIPFPTEDVGGHNAQITPRALVPQVVKRDVGNDTAHEVIAVSDGFTFTSPYIYLVYSSVWAKDRCGQRGNLYTSLTWSYLPEQLSVLDKYGYTQPLDLNELPCRKHGYEYGDGLYHPATFAAVPQLNMLEPGFKDCFIGYWQNLDPPLAFSNKNDFFDDAPQEPTVVAGEPALETNDGFFSVTSAEAETTPTPAAPLASFDALPEKTQASDFASRGPKSTDVPVNSPPKDGNIPLDSPRKSTIPSKPEVNPVVSAILAGMNPSDPNTPEDANDAAQPMPWSPIALPTIKKGRPTVTDINDKPDPAASNGDIAIAPGADDVAVVVGSSTQHVQKAPRPAPITVGAQTIKSADGHFQIDEHVIQDGGPAITLGYTPVSIIAGGKSAIIGSSTVELNAPPTFATPVTLAGQIVQPAGQALIIGSQTLSAGGPAAIINGQRISIAPGASSAVVGSSTLPLPALITPPPAVFGGQILTPEGDHLIITDHGLLQTHTLLRGAPPITIKNTPLSLAPDGLHALLGTSTLTLPTPAAPLPIVFAGHTLTPSGSVYLLNDQPLTPGGPSITVSGTPVGIALPGLNPSAGAGSFAAGSVTFSLPGNPRDDAVLVDGHALRPGAPALTLADGHVVSLGVDAAEAVTLDGASGAYTATPPRASFVVVDGQTFDLAQATGVSETSGMQAFHSAQITPLAGNQGVVVEGETFAVGETFVVNGTGMIAVSTGAVSVTGGGTGTGVGRNAKATATRMGDLEATVTSSGQNGEETGGQSDDVDTIGDYSSSGTVGLAGLATGTGGGGAAEDAAARTGRSGVMAAAVGVVVAIIVACS